MNILFSGLPQYGHLNNLIALAQAAQKLGHKVLLVTAKSKVNQLTSVIPCEAAGINWSGRLEEITDDPTHQHLTYINILTDKMIQDLLIIANNFNPELIISERDESAGPIAGEILGIPYAVTSSCLRPAFIAGKELISINKIRKKHGLNADNDGTIPYRYMYIDFIPDWLEDVETLRMKNRINGRFIEPNITKSKTELIDFKRFNSELPTIFVTLGTLNNSEEPLLTTIISVLAQQFNVIAATGIDYSRKYRFNKNVLITDWVNYSEVMKQCDAIVCHGGINTTLSAIINKLPLLLIPIRSDQSLVAEKCAKNGVALVIKKELLDSKTLTQSVLHLINDNWYQSNLNTLSQYNLKLSDAKSVIETLTIHTVLRR